MRGTSAMPFIMVFFGVFAYAVSNQAVSVPEPVDPHAARASRTGIPIPGIQVIFNCDKVKASMAEEVVFDVAILNVGTDTAYVFDRLEWGEGGGLLLWFRDGKEERFRPRVDHPYPPPPADDPGLFVRLEPGRFYGLRERWPVKNLGRGRPGRYTLWVEYEGPVFRQNVYDAKFNRDQMPYWFNFPGVSSNQVAFEVVP